MKVKVRPFGALNSIAGLKEVEVELPDGATVNTLLDDLLARFGDSFRKYVYNKTTGRPKSYLHFLVDGKAISSGEGFDTRLKDGQILAIVAAVGGGSANR
jgi:MoaD family protein